MVRGGCQTGQVARPGGPVWASPQLVVGRIDGVESCCEIHRRYTLYRYRYLGTGTQMPFSCSALHWVIGMVEFIGATKAVTGKLNGVVSDLRCYWIHSTPC